MGGLGSDNSEEPNRPGPSAAFGHCPTYFAGDVRRYLQYVDCSLLCGDQYFSGNFRRLASGRSTLESDYLFHDRLPPRISLIGDGNNCRGSSRNVDGGSPKQITARNGRRRPGRFAALNRSRIDRLTVYTRGVRSNVLATSFRTSPCLLLCCFACFSPHC